MPEFNYFNYFTEIEEHFWRRRGAHLLVSPLDWALVETWQKAGVPLPAVLKGIDRAFEHYARSRRGASGRTLKSLAYCTDAVLETAAEMAEAHAGAGPEPKSAIREDPFSRDDLRGYFRSNVQRLETAGANLPGGTGGAGEVAIQTGARLAEMQALFDSPAELDFEDLERRLTILEDKLFSSLVAHADEERQLAIRREMDRALAVCRRKMNAAQIEQVERQYLKKRLFEEMRIPRLSLFYLT
jgi:hypothetical protein